MTIMRKLRLGPEVTRRISCTWQSQYWYTSIVHLAITILVYQYCAQYWYKNVFQYCIPVLYKILKKIHNTGKKNYTSNRQVKYPKVARKNTPLLNLTLDMSLVGVENLFTKWIGTAQMV